MTRLLRSALGPLVPCLSVVVIVALAPAASADVFEPIQLASVTPTEQVNSAEDPAISANGRFLAFDGSVAGVPGVWRRDLLTGSVEPVAAGDAQQPGIDAPDARLPSISADGRYVSFTTTAQLDPANDLNAAPDVYVRDMTIEAGQPGGFTLASAADQASQGLTYDFGGQESFGRGSLASGRSAITADGRHVAFITTAVSNLANPSVADTPALQVAVRDLDMQRTRLVSTEYDAATDAMTTNPVPTNDELGATYGAVYPGGALLPSFPSSFRGATPSFAGASISADGTTVAWMGQSISRQARVMPAADLAGSPNYTEPLWRRIADGPGAMTRRVTGGSDPTSPTCPPGESQLQQTPSLSDPCQGPFEPMHESGSFGIFTLPGADPVPQLSADGSALAFLAGAREIASGEEFGAAAKASDDLYVVDMHEGLSRVRALRRLTELASSNISDAGRVAPIVDFGISPDGSQVAFSTQRTTFPLGSPAYVTAPSASTVAQELFDVDLENDTLTRVTQGYDGGVGEPINATTRSQSFTADGNTLAFASTAFNLVYGDGNGASDAFTVRRKRFATTIVQQSVSPAPANPTMTPEWRLAVTARSRRDGSVLLEVALPGVGSLRAAAESAVRISNSHARQARRARGKRGRSSTTVVTRRVAAATKTMAPDANGLASLRLLATPRYRALAARRGGLSANVTVTFAAPGHKTLRARIVVTFVRKVQRHKAHASWQARSATEALPKDAEARP
jgi:Tol biopolymer transport system component